MCTSLPSFMYVYTLTVPGVPENVTGNSPNSTSISVSWDHPLPQDQNGVILNYTVVSQLDNEINRTSTKNNSTMLTLTDLNIFTEYSIFVIAHTSVGAGNISTTITVWTLNDSKCLICISY